MVDIATIQSRIDAIDTMLAEGRRSVSSGDDSVEYDLIALQKERARLQRLVSGSSSSQFRRVVFKNG